MFSLRMGGLLGLAMLAALYGCAASSSSGDEMSNTRSIPLIMKLKAADDETQVRASLPALGGACGVRLEYTRPMSGGAHVVRMWSDAPEQALSCLRQQADVVYVQQDRVARPMGNGGVQ